MRIASAATTFEGWLIPSVYRVRHGTLLSHVCGVIKGHSGEL